MSAEEKVQQGSYEVDGVGKCDAHNATLIGNYALGV